MTPSQIEATTDARWLTRAETPADIPTIREVTVAAFPTAHEADIIDALRGDPAWIDGLSIVATDRTDRIVGHGLLSRGYIDDARCLVLGPVSVRPEDQNHGVGSVVNRALLDAARRMGEHHVVVVGHAEYYPRFGFGRASAHGIRLTIDAPDEAIMALTLDAAHPLPAGMVRYPGPFGV